MITVLDNLFNPEFNRYLVQQLQRSAEWRLCLDEHYLPGADLDQFSDTGSVYYTYTQDRDWYTVNSQDPARGYFNHLAETILHTALGQDWQNVTVLRVMWNYYSRASEGISHQDHKEQGIYSMVYNLSDTDGGTVINDQFYSGSEGRALVFPSNLTHRGVGPRLSARRFVLNCIFSADPVDK